MDANAELAKLQEQRSRAASRVSDLEREWREALEASRQASAELAELERHGGNAASRHKVEEKLAEAKRLADQPWSERLEGARAGLRDAERVYRAAVAANLPALVDAIEGESRLAAQDFNDAAAAILSAAVRWDASAQKLSSTIVHVARPGPMDVSRSKAEEAVRAVAALVAAGGEEGVVLDKRRPPWSRLFGLDEDVVEAEVVDVPTVTVA